MDVDVREVSGRPGVVANKDIISGSEICGVTGQFIKFNIDVIYNNIEISETEGNQVMLLEDKSWLLISSENDENIVLNNIYEAPPILEEVDYRTFGDYHRRLKEYDQQICNVKIEKKRKDGGKGNINVSLVASEDIKKGTEIRIIRGRDFWLRKYLRSEVNPLARLIFVIFLEVFNQSEDNLPDKLKGFEHFFVKWRIWPQEVCLEFLKNVLNVNMDGELIERFNLKGFVPRTILYRFLQAVGSIKPPTVSAYKHYPEALRPVAHQSRDLCFWPVQVGPTTDKTEMIRRKAQTGLEFGPNTTWTNFPKTKQVFVASTTDDLMMAQDGYKAGANLSAIGTCHLWSPLHVACHYGSVKVTKFLLDHNVVFNSGDRSGLSPLQLAERAGHTNLVRMLLGHAADHSVLPDTVTLTTLVRQVDSDDQKMASLEAAVNCKNVGNTAFKNKNYKSAFQLYSRGLELCPTNHTQMVILYSNRAQVLVTAKAFNLALRDINKALDIDPLHEKTLLRRAHCYENINPEKSLTDLDLLLYISVPDKLVNERRTFIFFKTIINASSNEDNKEEATTDKEKQKEIEMSTSTSVDIQGTSYQLASIPMSILLDLSLQDLRDLDNRVGNFDGNVV